MTVSWRKVVLWNLILIAVLGLAVILVDWLGHPTDQGFFCSDTSIRFPYKESTISTTLLLSIFLPLPNITIFICEFFKILLRKKGGEGTGLRRPPGRLVLLVLLIASFGTVSLFWLGVGFCQITVHLAKFLCGRLRPHFIEVCQPNVDCSLEINRYAYISNYTCNRTEMNLIKAARASFPSAHSAVAFYSALYTIAYLNRIRITVWSSRFPGYALQFILFLTAWYTSLTRVHDNMHHWTDVLAGGIIGTIFALIVINYVEPPKPRLDRDIVQELRCLNALPPEFCEDEIEKSSEQQNQLQQSLLTKPPLNLEPTPPAIGVKNNTNVDFVKK